MRIERLLPLVLVLALVPTVFGQVSPQTLGFTVYTDGVTRVDYHLNADPTQAQVNITLFGDTLEDLFILNQDGLPLSSTVVNGYHQVDSLGSNSLTVSYLTAELTGKNGAVWSFNVETSISAEIILPVGATIIDINDIPLEIETLDEQTKLMMPAGRASIYYIVGITDSETFASNAITEVAEAIQQAESNGIIVTDAVQVLSEAHSFFEIQDYLSALEKAEKALSLVGITLERASTAQAQINAAQVAVDAAIDAGKTVGIDGADAKLVEAVASFNLGDYEDSITLSKQALELAVNANAPSGRYNLMIIIMGGVIVIGAVTGFVFRSKSSKEEQSVDELEIDLETIFMEHPDLSMGDKEVLRFMAEQSGEVFANEIRERFDIPRTSTWRMIQRFMRYELVEERKIGGQSLVSIVERYRRRK